MEQNKYPYDDFIRALGKLAPDQLIGTARVLGVKLMTDEKDENDKPIMRDGKDIVNDILNNYAALNRNQRRNLLKIVKAARS